MLTQTCTITHTAASGTTDGEGQWVPGAQTVTSHRCRLEQVEASKGRTSGAQGETFSRGTDQVASIWRLFLLPDASIEASDLVTVGSDNFEVDGRPAVGRSPRGPHHIEARLRLVQR
jgi:hypothetical protein